MILTSPGNGAASETRAAAGGGMAEADAPADAAAVLAEKMDLQAIGVSQLAITRKKNRRSNFFRFKVFDVCLSVDKMQLLIHKLKTYHTHFHAMMRPHFNVEFDFHVSVRTCMMSTVTSKSKSTLGRFSDRVL